MDLAFQALLLFVGGVWAANVTELGLNAFVTSGERAMPSEFSLEEVTPFYWTNLTGHVLNVQAVSGKGQDMFLYAAPCLEYNNSTCISYEESNPGGGVFGGPGWVGTGGFAALASDPWQINLIYSSDNLTGTSISLTTVNSPTFALVTAFSTTSTATASTTSSCSNSASTSSGHVSAGAAAGIGIGCAAAGAIIASGVFICLKRRQDQKQLQGSLNTNQYYPGPGSTAPYSTSSQAPIEAKYTTMPPQSEVASPVPELSTRQLYELGGSANRA